MRKFLLLGAAVLLCQCGPQGDSSGLNTVHGEVDTRVDVSSSKPPYSYVGRFDVGCTGTLIGPNLVATALHCLLDEEKDNQWRDDVCYFRPNLKGPVNHRLISPDRALPKRVWYTQRKGTGIGGQPDVKADRGEDWAIIELDKNVGETHGYFSVSDQSFFAEGSQKLALDKMVRFLGYSSDTLRLNEDDELLPLPNGKPRRDGYTPSEDPSCLITNYAFQTGDPEKRYLLHNCKETRGASGGPLFHRVGESYEVLALQGADFPGDDYQPDYIKPGSERAPNANVAVPLDHLSRVYRLLSEALDVSPDATADELLSYVRSVAPQDESFSSSLEIHTRSLAKGPDCQDLLKVPSYKQAKPPSLPSGGGSPATPQPVPKPSHSPAPEPEPALQQWKLGLTYTDPAHSPYGFEGAYVASVIPGSPADTIGVAKGDYIESIDGKSLFHYFLKHDLWRRGTDGKVRENESRALATLLMQTDGTVDIGFLHRTPYNTWERVLKQNVKLSTPEAHARLIERQRQIAQLAEQRRQEEVRRREAEVRRRQEQLQRYQEELARIAAERQRLERERFRRDQELRSMLNNNVAVIAYNSYTNAFGRKTYRSSSLGRITIPAGYGYESVHNGCIAMVFASLGGNTYKYGWHREVAYYDRHFDNGSARQVEAAAKAAAENGAMTSCRNGTPAGTRCFGLTSVCSSY